MEETVGKRRLIRDMTNLEVKGRMHTTCGGKSILEVRHSCAYTLDWQHTIPIASYDRTRVGVKDYLY
jgi:hypothetical protein